MRKIDCKIMAQTDSRHLQQVYSGFNILRKNGIIYLSVDSGPRGSCFADPEKPILNVLVNNKYRVVYDTLDGFNFDDALGLDDNLKIFAEYLTGADFYFKRSYNSAVTSGLAERHKIYPLGLNYMVNTNDDYIQNKLSRLKKWRPLLDRFNQMFRAMPGAGKLMSGDFEDVPRFRKEPRIIFIAKAWDPDEVESAALKDERRVLNELRHCIIKECKSEFGGAFYGGFIDSAYSSRHYGDFLLPKSATNKSVYVRKMHEYEIGIVTRGLHNSTNWTVAEYVAASKAIVCQRLFYEAPGGFREGANYLAFETVSECLESARKLILDKALRYSMMENNHSYYHSFVKPESLVMNSLLKVLGAGD